VEEQISFCLTLLDGVSKDGARDRQMETTFSRNYSVQFVDHRCWECGTFWAIEEQKDIICCPRCAGKRNARLHETIGTLDKTIAGLKGQITRLKRISHRGREG
jgi:DNA-directed RNA polymerase subunit RPC12/RpoP